MSYRLGAPEWAFSLPVSPRAVVVVLRMWGWVTGTEAVAYLAGVTSEAPFVWPSRALLATKTNNSERSLRRHLKELVDVGAIEPETRVISGHAVDGWRLLDWSKIEAAEDPAEGDEEPHEGASEPLDPDPATAKNDRSAAKNGRCDGQKWPGDRPKMTAKPAKNGRAYKGINTPVNTPVITEKDDSAGRAIEPPAPLTLGLEEPDRLDPERLAGAVIELCVAGRRELGARARRTTPTSADRAAVVALAKAFDEPLVELPDGAADLRTEPGLRRAWALIVRRKTEELRRRAEASGDEPRTKILALKYLAADAAALLEDDGLDERRPAAPPRGRARASPGQGPPVNNTDLARYAELTDNLDRFENP